MKSKWRSIQLLGDTSDEVLNAFEERGWNILAASGEHLVWEGDICEAVYFIHSGVVEIYRNSIDGREHTLQVLYSGDVFNLVPALLDGGENAANARSMRETELLVIKKHDLLSILQTHPKLSEKFLFEIAGRMKAMVHMAGELALLSVRQRLALFLIRQADKSGSAEKAAWTREDIARQIGTVRDVVGRNLKQFEELGLVQRIKGNIQLLDQDGLQRIGEGRDAT